MKVFYGFQLFDFGKVPKNVSQKNDILSEHRIIKMRIITLSYEKITYRLTHR